MNQPQRSPISWSAIPIPINAHRQSVKQHSSQSRNAQFTPQIVAPVPVPEPPSKLEATPSKKTRRRGLVLSEQGWQKLLKAGIVYSQFGERYTYEQLSELTLLDPRTVCRLIGREVGVDRRTLAIFFAAFDLHLEKGDYTTPAASESEQSKRQRDNQSGFPLVFESPLAAIEPQSYADDIAQIKQRIAEDCHRLIALLDLDAAGSNSTNKAVLTVQLAPQISLQFNLNF